MYVRLLKQGERKTLETKTGADGRFVLSLAEAGTYVLHAEKSGWRDAATEPFEVVAGEKKKLELVMQTLDAAQAALPGGEQRLKTSSENIEFQDEPSFTVAGVTDYSNLGLHGSDAAAKTSDRLATAIVELNSGARGDGSNLGASQSKSELEREREQVSKELEAKDTADGHRILGSINERLGDPVTAVREFAEAATPRGKAGGGSFCQGSGGAS